MEEGKVRDFIVVGVPNSVEERHAEYFPQKPFEMMTDEQQESFYAMGRGDGSVFASEVRSDRYLRFLVEELKPYIDENFAVLTDRDNTFVMGSSMGGLISIYALARYPDTFGGAGQA
jgi:enterochelin esterase-like enzyme